VRIPAKGLDRGDGLRLQADAPVKNSSQESRNSSQETVVRRQEAGSREQLREFKNQRGKIKMTNQNAKFLTSPLMGVPIKSGKVRVKSPSL